jgi:myb proto-oncogene protein
LWILPNKGKKPGKWSPEEDAKLTEAVQKLSEDWVAVAAMVPGLTNIQCRYRWVRYLDPDRASNTVEEEDNNAGDYEALDSVPA